MLKKQHDVMMYSFSLKILQVLNKRIVSSDSFRFIYAQLDVYSNLRNFVFDCRDSFLESILGRLKSTAETRAGVRNFKISTLVLFSAALWRIEGLVSTTQNKYGFKVQLYFSTLYCMCPLLRYFDAKCFATNNSSL